MHFKSLWQNYFRQAVCRSTKRDCDKQSTNAAASDGCWCSEWSELAKHTCDTCNRRTDVYKNKSQLQIWKTASLTWQSWKLLNHNTGNYNSSCDRQELPWRAWRCHRNDKPKQSSCAATMVVVLRNCKTGHYAPLLKIDASGPWNTKKPHIQIPGCRGSQPFSDF